MKPTQLLESFRNIRKEFVAFASIVVIGLLAAVAFLSIVYSAATLKTDALNFFNSQNCNDELFFARITDNGFDITKWRE